MTPISFLLYLILFKCCVTALEEEHVCEDGHLKLQSSRADTLLPDITVPALDMLAEYKIFDQKQGQIEFKIEKVNGTTLNKILEYSYTNNIPISSDINRLVLFHKGNRQVEKFIVKKYEKLNESHTFQKYKNFFFYLCSDQFMEVMRYFGPIRAHLEPIFVVIRNAFQQVEVFAGVKLFEVINTIITWYPRTKNYKSKLYQFHDNYNKIWLVAVLERGTDKTDMASISANDIQEALSSHKEWLETSSESPLVGFCTKLSHSGVYKDNIQVQLPEFSYIWSIPCPD